MKILKLVFLLLLLQVLSFSISAQKQFKALVVTTTRGWHHEAQHAAFLAIQKLGQQHFFDVTLFEDPKAFKDPYVQQFGVIIFLHTKEIFLIRHSKK